MLANSGVAITAVIPSAKAKDESPPKPVPIFNFGRFDAPEYHLIQCDRTVCLTVPYVPEVVFGEHVRFVQGDTYSIKKVVSLAELQSGHWKIELSPVHPYVYEHMPAGIPEYDSPTASQRKNNLRKNPKIS